MYVKIITEGFRLTLPLPNALLLNGFVTGAISKALRKHVDFPITKEQLDGLAGALRQARRHFGSLDLVDVLSEDGNRVLIRL